jgi:hypothetical protein
LPGLGRSHHKSQRANGVYLFRRFRIYSSGPRTMYHHHSPPIILGSFPPFVLSRRYDLAKRLQDLGGGLVDWQWPDGGIGQHGRNKGPTGPWFLGFHLTAHDAFTAALRVLLTLVVIVQHRRSSRLNRHGSGTNFTFSQPGFVVGRGLGPWWVRMLVVLEVVLFSLLLYSTGRLFLPKFLTGLPASPQGGCM